MAIMAVLTMLGIFLSAYMFDDADILLLMVVVPIIYYPLYFPDKK